VRSPFNVSLLDALLPEVDAFFIAIWVPIELREGENLSGIEIANTCNHTQVV